MMSTTSTTTTTSPAAAAARARAAANIRATVERGAPLACPAAREGCKPRDYMIGGRGR